MDVEESKKVFTAWRNGNANIPNKFPLYDPFRDGARNVAVLEGYGANRFPDLVAPLVARHDGAVIVISPHSELKGETQGLRSIIGGQSRIAEVDVLASLENYEKIRVVADAMVENFYHVGYELADGAKLTAYIASMMYVARLAGAHISEAAGYDWGPGQSAHPVLELAANHDIAGLRALIGNSYDENVPLTSAALTDFNNTHDGRVHIHHLGVTNRDASAISRGETVECHLKSVADDLLFALGVVPKPASRESVTIQNLLSSGSTTYVDTVGAESEGLDAHISGFLALLRSQKSQTILNPGNKPPLVIIDAGIGNTTKVTLSRFLNVMSDTGNGDAYMITRFRDPRQVESFGREFPSAFHNVLALGGYPDGALMDKYDQMGIPQDPSGNGKSGLYRVPEGKGYELSPTGFAEIELPPWDSAPWNILRDLNFVSRGLPAR